MEITDRFSFIVRRLGERLWVKPLVACLLSIAGVFLAKAADYWSLPDSSPTVTSESVEALLSIMASSMLVIATFAVASMVSAYASASSMATPRSFRLIVADDVSQNALSTFIGAFIFSIVALTVMKNEFFGDSGLLTLFALTAVVFGAVIITFVRWMDQIARLGRLATSIKKVEEAAESAMRHRRAAPTLRGAAVRKKEPGGRAIYPTAVGYVQRVDVETLQSFAEDAGCRISVAALPGAFALPGRPLAFVENEAGGAPEVDDERITAAFVIGTERLFDEDPRFGLVVLAEIADKALSPGVNDPGTAISVIGSLARLLVLWAEPAEEQWPTDHTRVHVPELSVRDMFDDAFTPIARDGAGSIEVMVRLQKVFASLAGIGDPDMREAALAHARMALGRAEMALKLPEDLALVRELADFAAPGGS